MNRILLSMLFPILFAGEVSAGDTHSKLSSLADLLIKGYSAKLGSSRKILAVFSFNCDHQLQEQRVGFAVSELMSHRFTAASNFVVVERAEIGRVLAEQRLQASGAVESDAAVRLGKILGANLLLIGNIQRVGGEYQVNARLVNAETSEVIVSGYTELDPDMLAEDAGVYLNLVPETQTLGIYAIYNYRATSDKRAAFTEPPDSPYLNTAIYINPKPFDNSFAGGGLLYRPRRNIQINVEAFSSIRDVRYGSVISSNSVLSYNLPSSFRATAVSFSVNYVQKLSRRWNYWGGIGFQRFAFVVDRSVGEYPAGLFLKSGVEFKPQSRIGAGLDFKYDLRRIAVHSKVGGKLFELNPLSVESTITLYF